MNNHTTKEDTRALAASDDSLPPNSGSLEDLLKREDIALRKVERLCKEKELRAPVWLSPFVAALIAATLAALGNAVVTALNGTNQVALENRKAEQSRILEMIKTGDPDKAAVNLDFLLKTGLVNDELTIKALRKFLAERKPGQGPTLAAAATARTDGASFLSRLWNERIIPVCWEDPAASEEGLRKFVQQSIADTWEKESSVSFVGWNTCPETFDGVRVAVVDAPPSAKALGQFIRGLRNGLSLNFSFANASQSCQTKRELCIKAFAIHEFGHVLGFEHTQNRPDAPQECREMAQGSFSGFYLGPYDPYSVMNFCNTRWLNDGVLTDGDVAALRALYGPPSMELTKK